MIITFLLLIESGWSVTLPDSKQSQPKKQHRSKLAEYAGEAFEDYLDRASRNPPCKPFQVDETALGVTTKLWKLSDMVKMLKDWENNQGQKSN